MDDRSLVAELRAGDVDGLAGVYDAYADRLFAYAVTMLHDRDAAADAVHDALLVARERVGQLRDPDRLRPWLYAIVRNECLRLLRDRRRSAPLDEAGEVIDESADAAAGARAAEMRELVWAAAAALNPGEREVLELSVRHGLEGADLAAALGTGVNQAHALTSRARAQLERSLGALLVARAEPGRCEQRDALLAGWDGTLTPLLRKRLARHVDSCDTCGETRRSRLNPVALLAGVPLVLAPPALRDRVLDSLRLVSHDTPPPDPDAADSPADSAADSGADSAADSGADSAADSGADSGADSAANAAAGPVVGPVVGSVVGSVVGPAADAAAGPGGGDGGSGGRDRRRVRPGPAAVLGAGVGATLAVRAGPWRPDGFPRPLGRERRRGGVWLPSAVAALVLALLLGLGLVLRPDTAPSPLADDGPLPTGAGQLPVPTEEPTGGTTGQGRTTAPAPTSAPTTPSALPPTPTNPADTTGARTPVPTAVPTAGPTVPPRTTRAPTVPPTRPPTRPPPRTTPPRTTPPAPDPEISLAYAAIRTDCKTTGQWVARLTATVTGATASSVVASWTTPRGVRQEQPLSPSGGGVWTATVTLPVNQSFVATATAATPAGAVTSAPVTLRRACRA